MHKQAKTSLNVQDNFGCGITAITTMLLSYPPPHQCIMIVGFFDCNNMHNFGLDPDGCGQQHYQLH